MQSAVWNNENLRSLKVLSSYAGLLSLSCCLSRSAFCHYLVDNACDLFTCHPKHGANDPKVGKYILVSHQKIEIHNYK